MKYPIKREFFPFSHFKPPIRSGFLNLAAKFMKTPKRIFKDKNLDVKRYEVESFDKEKIECFLFSPKNIGDNAPCLCYIHGGGFVLSAAGYHYKNAIRYAKETGCKVWFVNYRLAPKYPFPIFYEDCYCAVHFLQENARTLGVNVNKLAIGGDSAGATLAVGVCMTLSGKDSVMTDAFGIVAMVAMTPLITIQLLGFRAIMTKRVKEKIAMKRILDSDDEQIISFM